MAEDPRIAKTRATVLTTAADVVVEGGPGALTIDAVVARSGVARSTIYRHWPTREALLVDVFEFCVPTFLVPPPELGFPDALRLFVRDVVRQFSDPKWARMLPALLVLKAYEPALADIEQQLEERQVALSDDLLRRGVESGHVPADVTRDSFSALVIGPLVFVLVTGIGRLDDAFADETTDVFLAGMAARVAAPR